MKFTLFHVTSLVLAVTAVSALPRSRTNADLDIPNQASAVEVQISNSAQLINRDSNDHVIITVNDLNELAQNLRKDLAELTDDIVDADIMTLVSVDGKRVDNRFAILKLLDIIKSLSSQTTAATKNIHKLDSQNIVNNLIRSIDHTHLLVSKLEAGLEGSNFVDIESYTDRFFKVSKKFKQRLQNLEKVRPSKTDQFVRDEFEDIEFASPTALAMIRRKEPLIESHHHEYIFPAGAVKVHKAIATHRVLPQEVIDAFLEFDDGSLEMF